MKTKLSLLLICCLACFSQANAQKFSYGPAVGFITSKSTGMVRLDSVQVELDGGGGLRGYFGGFVSYEFNSVLRLSSGVNYYPDYFSYLVYNTNKNCQFCPLVKGGVIGQESLEVPLMLEVNVPLTDGKFFATAGVAPSIRLARSGSAYYYHRDAGQGVSDVLPAMSTAVKPVLWDYTLGVGANIWRLRFEFRHQANLSKSATNAINVWGKRYDFRSSHENYRLGVGYNLNWKKRE